MEKRNHDLFKSVTLNVRMNPQGTKVPYSRDLGTFRAGGLSKFGKNF